MKIHAVVLFSAFMAASVPAAAHERVEVEAGAASVLNGLGFTRDKLKVGDIVTISGSPSRRDRDKFMLGRDLTKQKDNSYVPMNIASRSILEVKTDAVATSIAGTWFSPMSSFSAYMGAAGNFARNDEARQVAKAMSDSMSARGPTATGERRFEVTSVKPASPRDARACTA